MKVVGIIGTIFGSKTKIALQTLKFNKDIEYEIIDLANYNLPYADGRVLGDYDEKTQGLLQDIMDADALIIGTPIFQASMPGVLKNMLDLIPIGGLAGKPVGLIVTAGSEHHYLVGEYQILPIFQYMKADVISKYVYVTQPAFYKDTITDDGIHLRLEALVKTLEEKLKQKPKFDF